MSSDPAAVLETLAKEPGGCAILLPALLDYLRAARRAKLAEAAALQRLERTLLTIPGLHPNSEQDAPR